MGFPALRPGPRQLRWLFPIIASTLTLFASAGATRAEVAFDRPGSVERLPATWQPHWLWASDPLLRRAALIDLDGGQMLGTVDGGFGVTMPLVSRDGRAIYVPETHFSRGSRGERTDVVTFYETRTLAAGAEVVLPPKRASNVLATANAALSDDDRFLAVFNMTPATSLSIVDVREQQFASEISTPGCSLVYPAGERRFLLLCADGSLLTVTIDDRGQQVSKLRSEPFFDEPFSTGKEAAGSLGFARTLGSEQVLEDLRRLNATVTARDPAPEAS